MKKISVFSVLTGSALFIAGVFSGAGAAQAASEVSYKQDIQPIFNDYCVACHLPGGSGYEASGLDLSNYAGVIKGTKHGPIISKGDPLTSNLMAILEGRTDSSIRMPHSDRRDMNQEDRRILRAWIVEGATKEGYAGKPASVIQELCMDCHIPGGSGYEASGLDMSSYETLMKGTSHGPIVVPGDPVTSNLMVLVEGRAMGGLRMPHNERGAPTPMDRKALRKWILEGAPDN